MTTNTVEHIPVPLRRLQWPPKSATRSSGWSSLSPRPSVRPCRHRRRRRRHTRTTLQPPPAPRGATTTTIIIQSVPTVCTVVHPPPDPPRTDCIRTTAVRMRERFIRVHPVARSHGRLNQADTIDTLHRIVETGIETDARICCHGEGVQGSGTVCTRLGAPPPRIAGTTTGLTGIEGLLHTTTPNTSNITITREKTLLTVVTMTLLLTVRDLWTPTEMIMKVGSLLVITSFLIQFHSVYGIMENPER